MAPTQRWGTLISLERVGLWRWKELPALSEVVLGGPREALPAANDRRELRSGGLAQLQRTHEPTTDPLRYRGPTPAESRRPVMVLESLRTSSTALRCSATTGDRKASSITWKIRPVDVGSWPTRGGIPQRRTPAKMRTRRREPIFSNESDFGGGKNRPWKSETRSGERSQHVPGGYRQRYARRPARSDNGPAVAHLDEVGDGCIRLLITGG
jgi:hypothetical protein